MAQQTGTLDVYATSRQDAAETALEMIAHEPEFASWPKVAYVSSVNLGEKIGDRYIAHVTVAFDYGAGSPVARLEARREAAGLWADHSGRGTGPNRYPSIIRDASGRPVDVG